MRAGPGRLLLGCVALGGLYGWAVAAIPLPEPRESVFWVSNLAAPWLVLAFLVGRLQRSRAWAVAAATLTEVAGLLGFYSHFLVLHTGDPSLPDKPLLPRMIGNIGGWLAFVAPWLPAAVAAGLVFGLLGLAWRRSRPLVAAPLLGLPFLLEPWAWRVHQGFWEAPIWLWFAESLIGVAVLVVVAALARRPPHDTPTERTDVDGVSRTQRG